jgi:hypothetical protein
MHTNSVKRLLKTKKKSFFDLSVYQFLGMFGVLESDIKKLDFYDHWCEVSRGSGMLPIMQDNGEEGDRALSTYTTGKNLAEFL